MGWQPIETAPKDGTRIIIARAGWNLMPEVRWSSGLSGWAMDPADVIHDPTPDDALIVWSETDELADARPTHWMPLPEGPK